MQTTILGRTNIHISCIGFGGLPIQRLEKIEAINLIHHAIDNGINIFDTAIKYGSSEEYIGAGIKGYDRDKLVIISKTGAHGYEDVKKKIKLSLDHFQTDYIDIYEFHNLADKHILEKALSKDGSIKALLEAKNAGLIKHIAVTSHNPDTCITAIKSGYFEAAMFPFNFVAYDTAKKVLEACKEQGMGFLAMKPLAGGVIENVPLAIKFLLNIPDIVTVVGLEKIQELNELLDIERKHEKLNSHDLIEIEKIKQTLGTEFCHRCGYCLPCPQEIPIPLINNLSSFINREIPSVIFNEGKVSNDVVKAQNCSDCGECEEKCPYHLAIRELMKKNISVFIEAQVKYLKNHSIFNKSLF